MDESPPLSQSESETSLVLQPLDARVKRVWMVNSIIGALVFAGFLAAIEFIFLRRIAWWPEPALTVGWPLLSLTWGLSMIRRRFASWRYGLDDLALTVEYGVWNKVRKSVPRGRIQHVEVHEGPWDRRFGIKQLNVHTAGTFSIEIPGLTPIEADRLRRELMRSAMAPPQPFDADSAELLQP